MARVKLKCIYGMSRVEKPLSGKSSIEIYQKLNSLADEIK